VILSQHPLNLALIRSGRTVETCIQSLPFLPADVQHVILKVPPNHLPVTSPVVGASG